MIAPPTRRASRATLPARGRDESPQFAARKSGAFHHCGERSDEASLAVTGGRIRWGNGGEGHVR
jgi:hypothetical protein